MEYRALCALVPGPPKRAGVWKLALEAEVANAGVRWMCSGTYRDDTPRRYTYIYIINM